MIQVFISYSRTDAEFAHRLATDLDQLGAGVWIDVDAIPPGVNWSTAIQQGLDTCDILLLIISPESMASQNVEDEWQYFRDESKPILPVLWRPTDQMHFQLRRIQYINFHGQSYATALRQLHTQLLAVDDTLGDIPAPVRPDAGDSGDKRITLHTARELAIRYELTGHRDSVLSVAFSPDNQLVASCSEDKTVRFWYTARRKRIKMMIGHEKQVNAVAFSPSGTFLASASDDRTVRLWNVGKRFGIGALRGHTGPVTDVIYSPTATLLASSSEDYTIRLWDARKRTASITLKSHDGPVNRVVFSPDGTMLASASADLTVRLWDVAEQRVLTTYELPDEPRSLGFNPGGNLLAVGLADSGVVVLALDHGDDTQSLTLAQAGTIFYADYNARCVRGTFFSPDGSLLAMASLDGNIRLWNVDELRRKKQGRALKVLRGHEGGITDVEFSPDGSLLASSAHDRSLRLWALS